MHIGFGLWLWQQGASFNPLSLFAAGEQGAWYDPSDLSTLFQDVAGTIPVTSAGQPVGLMRDKSGRGNHATQATATSRPILQTANGLWYLAFDGVDDGLATATVNLTTTDKMTVWAGVHKSSEIAAGVVVEFSTDFNNTTNTFSLLAPSGQDEFNYSGNSKATISALSKRTPFTAPHRAVLCMQSDIAAPSVALRVNTTTATATTTSQGVGNYGNYPLYIGARNGGAAFSLNGRLYGLIVRGVSSGVSTVSDAETWMNSKTGAY